MARGSVDMNFLFTLGELQRLVRAYADKQAARYGITRAQWAVLAKVERTEGHETVGTRRTDGNAADHADATDRPVSATTAGSNAAATRPTAASTGFICARPRGRCSES